MTDVGTGGVPDASIALSARVTSPSIGKYARLICDIYWLDRWRNYLNAQSFLGGDFRLRGYPTAFTQGSDMLSYNMELRSRPLQLYFLHVAVALFYDVGEAYTPQLVQAGATVENVPQPGPFTNAFRNFRPLQGVGFGLRGMIPLLDRVVYRFDLGFPLGYGRSLGVPPVGFFLTLGQAYDPPNTTTIGGQGINGAASGITGVTPVLPTGQGP